MAELKTKRNDEDLAAFFESISDDQKRRDCMTLDAMMRRVAGEPGALWGASIIGYGSYRYRYASGREGDWFRIGFSPRARNLSLYLMNGYDHAPDLLALLGPHSLGKACLYIRRLADVDETVLEALLRSSWAAGGMSEIQT